MSWKFIFKALLFKSQRVYILYCFLTGLIKSMYIGIQENNYNPEINFNYNVTYFLYILSMCQVIFHRKLSGRSNTSPLYCILSFKNEFPRLYNNLYNLWKPNETHIVTDWQNCGPNSYISETHKEDRGYTGLQKMYSRRWKINFV